MFTQATSHGSSARYGRLAARLAPSAATLSLALVLAVPGLSQIQAYHGQSKAQHQASFSSLSSQGYRLRSLSVYDSSQPGGVYAAVWEKKSGPGWVGFHDKSQSEYQALFNTYSGQGYRSDLVTATGSGSSKIFAGTFVKESVNHQSSGLQDLKGLQKWLGELRGSNMIPLNVAVFGSSSQPWYLATAVDNAAGIHWGYTFSPASSFQSHFNAMTAGWARPYFITRGDVGMMVTLWRDDQVSGSWMARAGMSSSQYQAEFKTQKSQGRYPLCVQASGTVSSPLLDAVWVKSLAIVAPVWQVSGTAVPGFDVFDNYVKGLMQAGDVRAASLAIARDGRLSYARAYTLAEPGYPVTQPTSEFRIASMSKPLTGTAFHASVEQNRLQGGSTIPGTLGVSSWTQSTMDLMLGHSGGWRVEQPKNTNLPALGFDPCFYDATIANALNVPLPITRAHIRTYMANFQMLQFMPGTASPYTNFGFSLVGDALESVNRGLTYEQIVRRDVFAPLGLSRPRVGRSLFDQRGSAEVRYHPRDLRIVTAVTSSAQTAVGAWVPNQYGGWNQRNLGPEGGWVMAAADYAKFLCSFDASAGNPLLTAASTATMWSSPIPNVNMNTLRGWFAQRFVDENGQSIAGVQHNGGTAGTATLGVRRSDGLSFVLFMNRNLMIGGKDGLHADPHGIALNDLANRVAFWPTHDLFPSVGISSFPRRATIGSVSPPKMENVTERNFVITGSNLETVVRVSFVDSAGVAASISLNSVTPNGFFRTSGSSQMSVQAPQGLAPGPYTLVLTSSSSSPTVGVSISLPTAPTMVAPGVVLAGSRFGLVAGKGAGASGRTLALLALSSSAAPSAVPGMINLGIGNAFQQLYMLPAVGFSSSAEAASWNFTSLAVMRGTMLHFQTVLVDPTQPGGIWPVSETNVQTVLFR